jgi:putative ABC transport system permease protein
MLKNYFKIAIRALWKNKKLSIINILGLAIGIACSLLIFLFVQDELKYDRYHTDSALIYRVVKDFINDDGSRIPDATTPGPLAAAMQREIPEVVKITRVHPNWGGSTIIQYNDKKISEERVYRADSSFFEVFSFEFLKGNPKTALSDINSIVLTETTARRYFGDDDPIGKTLKLSGQRPGLEDVAVTAVIADVPLQSHFHFDFLLSYRRLPPQAETNWYSYNYYTYVKVKSGTAIDSFEAKIQDLFERNQDDKLTDFYVQPIIDIHLKSHLKWELEPNGDLLYVYIFSIVGLFILLIAAINYINLSTARSTLRAKETGIRKVSGAVRSSLVFQFLLESVIVSLVASVVAVSLAYALLPIVNELTQKQLLISGELQVMLYLFIVALLIGVIAGIFPALYLSSFKPVAVLKGLKVNDKGALNLRKFLVVVQFTISIAMITCVLVIMQQTNFLQNAKLGFDKEQIVVIRNLGNRSRAERHAFVNSLKQLSGVKHAATSGTILGSGFSTARLSAVGSKKEQQINFTSVSFDYLDVVGIEIKEGRGFSNQFPADTVNNGIPGGPLNQRLGGIVINEQAVKEFELGPSPVGKQLVWSSDADTTYYVEVVGVARNFHFTSLRNEIKPYGFLIFPNNQNNVTVKLSQGDIQGTLNQLEKVWRKSFDDTPFEYTFLDENISKLYVAEVRFQKVFFILVILAIIISCLGLFALAAFSAEQRVKEIGIRKVLGASVTHVIVLLSKDFLKLVVFSLTIAIPIAIYGMHKWLEGFAYRVEMQWWIFVTAGVIALLIAFFTISTQAFKAAIADPVKNLRSE